MSTGRPTRGDRHVALVYERIRRRADPDAPVSFVEIVAFESLTTAQFDVLHAGFLVREHRQAEFLPDRECVGRVRRGLWWSAGRIRSVGAAVRRAYEKVGAVIAPTQLWGCDRAYYRLMCESEPD